MSDNSPPTINRKDSNSSEDEKSKLVNRGNNYSAMESKGSDDGAMKSNGGNNYGTMESNGSAMKSNGSDYGAMESKGIDYGAMERKGSDDGAIENRRSDYRAVNEVRPKSEVSLTTAFPPYSPRTFVAPSIVAITPGFTLGTDGRKQVVVLGSGDFGLALTGRLSQANYRVVVASRNPNRTRERVMDAGGNMATHTEALGVEGSGGVVVVAVPSQHHSSLPLALLTGKIVIDVSNRNPKDKELDGRSRAEALQVLVPGARVVKAFNVLSAYALSHGVRGTKEVPVCSDDDLARELVCKMVRDLGFDPVDQGPLLNAREVELIPLRFFPAWKFGFLVSLIVWLFFFFLILFEWDVYSNIKYNHNTTAQNLDPPDWSGLNRLLTTNVAITSGSTSLTLLALCYLPGVLAGYLQLWRGTKYSEFPAWLDTWLRGRKQLGLIMLLHAGIHGINFFGSTGGSSNWRGPTFVACGMFGLVLAGILGISSLPSVSGNMTWREFTFVQSRLGWLTLLFCTLHVVFYEWHSLIQLNNPVFLPSVGQMVMGLPLLTILLKLPLLVPWVDSALTSIRQGNERLTIQVSV